MKSVFVELFQLTVQFCFILKLAIYICTDFFRKCSLKVAKKYSSWMKPVKNVQQFKVNSKNKEFSLWNCKRMDIWCSSVFIFTFLFSCKKYHTRSKSPCVLIWPILCTISFFICESWPNFEVYAKSNVNAHVHISRLNKYLRNLHPKILYFILRNWQSNQQKWKSKRFKRPKKVDLTLIGIRKWKWYNEIGTMCRRKKIKFQHCYEFITKDRHHFYFEIQDWDSFIFNEISWNRSISKQMPSFSNAWFRCFIINTFSHRGKKFIKNKTKKKKCFHLRHHYYAWK